MRKDYSNRRPVDETMSNVKTLLSLPALSFIDNKEFRTLDHYFSSLGDNYRYGKVCLKELRFDDEGYAYEGWEWRATWARRQLLEVLRKQLNSAAKKKGPEARTTRKPYVIIEPSTETHSGIHLSLMSKNDALEKFQEHLAMQEVLKKEQVLRKKKIYDPLNVEVHQGIAAFFERNKELAGKMSYTERNKLYDDLLEKMSKEKHLIVAPSKDEAGFEIKPYDPRHDEDQFKKYTVQFYKRQQQFNAA